MEFVPHLLGKFGCDEVHACPVSFRHNKKRGMDEKEFAKYLLNFIVPLFPNAKDKPGHRVLLKVDSGPGRMNLKLLTKLRLLGFVLYPCVPNTTHVMHKLDQNNSPFKTQFLCNLDLIVDARLEANKSLSSQPKFVGLPLFGGIVPESECNIKVSAFQKTFSRIKMSHSICKGWRRDEGGSHTCLPQQPTGVEIK